MTPPDPVALALLLARILERLGVRYCIGGSVASSVYGEVRTTLDVDVVADLQSEDVEAFVAALDPDFHVVFDAVRRAVEERTSFNLIHDEMLVKADFESIERRSLLLGSAQIVTARRSGAAAG